MAWTKYQLFLAAMLVVTGSINTLAAKFASNTPAYGRPNGTYFKNGTLHPTDAKHNFEHPFLQATGMFIGEFSCLLFFKLMMFVYQKKGTPKDAMSEIFQGNQDFNPLIFYAPAFCDMIGTSLMYVGLIMTYPASFQMFRGAVIVFTEIFSIIFLKRKSYAYKWAGILLVLAGLVVLALADMRTVAHGDYTTTEIITGDLIIVLAQINVAIQMVLEEKFVSKNNVPALQAVGWEGLFGMCTLGLLLIPMYFIKPNGAPFEDSVDGLYQIIQSGAVSGGFFGTMISISFFNFAGISVTKEMSATTRMVLDSVRTIVIWVTSFMLPNPPTFQASSFITLGGFVVLLIGMIVYNNILIVPFMVKKGWIRNPEGSENEHRALEDNSDLQ